MLKIFLKKEDPKNLKKEVVIFQNHSDYLQLSLSPRLALQDDTLSDVYIRRNKRFSEKRLIKVQSSGFEQALIEKALNLILKKGFIYF